MITSQKYKHVLKQIHDEKYDKLTKVLGIKLNRIELNEVTRKYILRESHMLKDLIIINQNGNFEIMGDKYITNNDVHNYEVNFIYQDSTHNCENSYNYKLDMRY